ncbi:hypothetical protein F5Y07DRAFT_210186 [Xylaria sp. FL0933]|nr:hypothetical protein F5Y07DRAFT_210186 [Xylaria sp. FL0933]
MRILVLFFFSLRSFPPARGVNARNQAKLCLSSRSWVTDTPRTARVKMDHNVQVDLGGVVCILANLVIRVRR